MYMARPRRRTGPRPDLRGIFRKDRLEVSGAVAAGVESCEEIDVGFERRAVVWGGLVGELRHRGVEELPSCIPQLCSTGYGGQYQALQRHHRGTHFRVAFSSFGAVAMP